MPLALVHGDCQPSNVLVADGADPLVIDWEFAHIGDPREDIGYYSQIPLLPNVLWSHPAYANKHIVIRNDREIVRFSLASGS